jgi:MSHA biogenesis protein MshE
VAGALGHLALEELLLGRGLVTRDDLDALPDDPDGRLPLADRLVAAGCLTEEQIAFAISEELGYPLVTLSASSLDRDLVRRVPPADLRRFRAVPLLDHPDEQGGGMDVAFSDPTDSRAIEALSKALDRRIRPAVATTAAIHAAHRAVLGAPEAGEGRAREEEAWDASGALRLYGHLLSAVEENATEMHFVPDVAGGTVRRRVGGQLVDAERCGPGELIPLLARLKGLASVPPRDAPRPRRMALATNVAGKDVRLTIAFVPTAAGEAASVVIHPVAQLAEGAATHSPTEVGGAVLDAADFLRRGSGLFAVNDAKGERALAFVARALAAACVGNDQVVAVSSDEPFSAPGCLVLSAAQFAGGFAEAAAAALWLAPDVLVLIPPTGNLPPAEAILRARDGRRVVVVGPWRDAAETLVALRRVPLPEGCVESALRAVFTFADLARATGRDAPPPPPIVETVRPSADDRARLLEARSAADVRAAFEACGHQTLRRIVAHLAVRGEARPGAEQEAG